MKKEATAIIGMSPGNSYFKQPIVHQLLEFVTCQYLKTRVWVPDLPAEHTYKALGYSCQRSKKKAREYGNKLKKQSRSIIEQLLQKEPHADLQMIDWRDDIETSCYYQDKLRYIYKLYESCDLFYQDARHETKRVIESYPHHKQVASRDALDEGVHYLLKELAFLDSAQYILDSQNCLLIYHRQWPVFENYIKGVYDGIAHDFGFAIVAF